MAPRRKRTVLDDSDSEEERAREQRRTKLHNFFSPNSKAAAASASIASISSPTASAAGDVPTTPTTPTPARRTTRSTAAKTPTKTPLQSPLKSDRISASSPAASSPFGRILTSRIKDSNGNKGATNGGSNVKSPCPSPEKRRGSKSLKLADEKGKSADLVALFTKQAEKALNSPPKKTVSLATVSENTRNGADDEDLDLIISDDEIADEEISESSAVVASYVGSRAQKRWKSSGITSLSSSQQLPPPSFPSSMGPPSSQAVPLPSSQRFKRPARPGASNGSTAAPGASQSAANDDDARPWSERFAPTNLDELAVHKKKVADVRRWIEDVMGGRSRQRLLVLKGAAGTGKTTTMRLLAKDMGLDILEWRNPIGASAAGLTSQGFTSASAQFDEFLNRGSRFAQLDLDGNGSDSDEASSAAMTTSADPSAAQRRKIIIIEEFPNTFMRSSSALTGFRNSVLQYLAANTPSMTTYAQRRALSDPLAIAPVVMIVSETLLTTTSASADSFTAHRLLGPELLRHPGTALIEFNAIAPSLLAKALELLVQKEARKSGRRRTPGPLVLKRLGEVGDVRSAIASLEFFCVKGDDQGDWGAKVAFTKTRKGPKDAAMTKGERETLEMVSRREASLGVFHAVGKVVYNKRDDLPPPAGSEQALAEVLPEYLVHHSRPKPSLVSVDTLIDETGTDTHTFISSLHENYALSCEQTGPMDPMSSIDYINGCIEYLSESDLLCPTWDIFFGGHGSNRHNFGRDSGSHVLRQDEMAFQVAVRGLLFSLPSPVKRSAATNHYQRSGNSFNGGDGGGGGNQFKMFYPMYLKLWRSREEMEALVDVWSSKLLRGEMGSYSISGIAKSSGAGGIKGTMPSSQRPSHPASRALAFRRPQQKFGFISSQTTSQSQSTQQVTSGSQRRPLGGQDPNRKAPFTTIKEEENDDTKELVKAAELPKALPNAEEEEDNNATPLLSLGSSARQEMILERLPYMALIARGKRCSFGTLGMRDLEKVVSFHGIGAVAAATAAEEAEEDVADAGLGAGSGMPVEDAWATDKPTDDSSPRKRRRPVPQPNGRNGSSSNATTQPNGRKASEAEEDGLSTGLPIYKLVLSDDDIEDSD